MFGHEEKSSCRALGGRALVLLEVEGAVGGVEHPPGALHCHSPPADRSLPQHRFIPEEADDHFVQPKPPLTGYLSLCGRREEGTHRERMFTHTWRHIHNSQHILINQIKRP
ncbi:hypothetical protein E2C01_043713 [Portunus trituberculatus]|uniref:Uncharacterized protein n=1 Tax=Portunus trituberculatus TaxID=210409 RepID=A0A5B7FYB0_PORTR|nr:hypothetical protein [Portunus trituberculatus]